MSYDLELLLKYPMIMQRQSAEEEYYGYIKVKENHFKINLIRDMKRFKLEINEDLEMYKSMIKKLSRECIPDPVEYLDKLTEILSSEVPEHEIENHTATYRKVLQEYAELKQFYINIHKSTLSSDLKTVNIIQLDERGRQHEVTIDVSYANEEKLFRIVNCDLPESQMVFEPQDSLISLYESFISRVECPKLQMIFDILDEIDEHCWVLDPEKPTRKDLYRRIVIEPNLSVVITFSSLDIRDLPQIKFLGPHGAVKKFSDIVKKNFINWNPNEDISSELLKLLEIESFPSKPKDAPTEELLVNEGECCVCFSLRLNNQLPDVVCPNPSCNQCFHAQCLYEASTKKPPRLEKRKQPFPEHFRNRIVEELELMALFTKFKKIILRNIWSMPKLRKNDPLSRTSR